MWLGCARCSKVWDRCDPLRSCRGKTGVPRALATSAFRNMYTQCKLWNASTTWTCERKASGPRTVLVVLVLHPTLPSPKLPPPLCRMQPRLRPHQRQSGALVTVRGMCELVWLHCTRRDRESPCCPCVRRETEKATSHLLHVCRHQTKQERQAKLALERQRRAQARRELDQDLNVYELA